MLTFFFPFVVVVSCGSLCIVLRRTKRLICCQTLFWEFERKKKDEILFLGAFTSVKVRQCAQVNLLETESSSQHVTYGAKGSLRGLVISCRGKDGISFVNLIDGMHKPLFHVSMACNDCVVLTSFLLSAFSPLLSSLSFSSHRKVGICSMGQLCRTHLALSHLFSPLPPFPRRGIANPFFLGVCTF